MNKQTIFMLLSGIILLGVFFRFFNLNWDGGFHMHPDERAIILSVINLEFPQSIQEFLSAESTWNPKFFAYGSLPFYLLYFAGAIMGIFHPILSEYDGITIVGRHLSVIFDLGTLLFTYLIGRELVSRKFGLLAAFFYAVSVLPIQLSHFYAVDTILTFFVTGTLFFLLRYLKNASIRLIIVIGIFLGAAAAAKISALVLLLPVGLTFLLQIVRHTSAAKSTDAENFGTHVTSLFLNGLGIFSIAAVTLIIFQPYMVLDFQTFLMQTLEQSRMTRDPFTFPYTLQYVGKIAYVYELKNIFFFGLGPILTILALCGIIWNTITLLKHRHSQQWRSFVILHGFFWVYFLLVGSFAIGFMRYMLPLYPLFCIFAAFATYILYRHLVRKNIPVLVTSTLVLLLLGVLVWPFSFLQIYTRDNTRLQATTWIHAHIPSGKTIAIEHWDDALPMFEQQRYVTETLELYQPDTPEKWDIIRQQLNRTDYIILASNRLYTPLMKLTNCQTLPQGRCYLQSAEYYRRLFNETLGFKKVADISSYPTIPLLNIPLNDQGADESFTVYDHPRIIIFKKE